jgi:type II secretory pathway component PulK
MTRNRESGVALLSAILVLMLMSALLIGFVAMVNADQMASLRGGARRHREAHVRPRSALRGELQPLRRRYR